MSASLPKKYFMIIDKLNFIPHNKLAIPFINASRDYSRPLLICKVWDQKVVGLVKLDNKIDLPQFCEVQASNTLGLTQTG